jgi:hypothetical protein
MKQILLPLLLLGWLAVSANAVERSSNVGPVLALSVPMQADADATATLTAIQQLRDIQQRKAAAVSAIPGMRQLETQIADLTARLRVLEEARRALLASNQTVVATFEQQRAQVRATLQRRDDPQKTALVQQSLAQLQSQILSNQAAAVRALPLTIK